MKCIRPRFLPDEDRELSLFFFRLRRQFIADPDSVESKIMAMEGFSRSDKLLLLEYLRGDRTPDFVEFYLEKKQHWNKYGWV